MAVLSFGGVSYFYLPRQPESKGQAVAVGAAGRGGHRRRAPALHPGPEPRRRAAPAGADCPLRLPLHPHGGGQHPGLPALRRLLFAPAPAILRMEGALILNRKQKKELRRQLSTRQPMGIDQLTKHGLKTIRDKLVFFFSSRIDSPFSPPTASIKQPPGKRTPSSTTPKTKTVWTREAPTTCAATRSPWSTAPCLLALRQRRGELAGSPG